MLKSNHIHTQTQRFQNAKYQQITNKLEINKLTKHPYIDYYSAKAIVVYRQNHGKYNSVEDIKNYSFLY